MNNKLLSELVKTEFSNAKMMKYFDHTERVVGYIKELSKNYVVKDDLLIACGWLHDIGRVVDNSYIGHINSLEKKARQLLSEANFTPSDTATIISIAVTHHPKTDEKLLKIEEQILYDADNLELVGSLGLLRWFGGMPEKTLELSASARMFMNLYDEAIKLKGTFFYTKKATFLAGCRPIENYEFCKSLIRDIDDIYINNDFCISKKSLFAEQKTNKNRTIVLLSGLRCSGKTFSREIILDYFDVDYYHTNYVKTGDADANTIGPKEIVKRYGRGISYFYFLENDLKKFFEQTKKNIVIDSVKSKNDVSVIKSFFPKCNILVIWFHANFNKRLERYMDRDILNNIRNSDLVEHDNELSALGIWDIMKNADYVINTDTTKEKLTHRLSEIFAGLI
ncbi:MAG: HD domain-containing protein [Firmicutes bacterium]|nr:HD domain-containing protein [Bacillota bacterium]